MVDVVVLNNLGGGQSVQVDTLPLPGQTVKGRNWKVNIDAGKGPNSCICMGRLGIRTAFIGKAGKDAPGDRGESWMAQAGVDTSGLLRSDQVSTGQGIRVVEQGGNNLIVCGESSSRALSVDEALAQLHRFQGASFFLTGFEVREELALAAAREAKAMGMRTALNFSPIQTLDVGPLSYIDYLVVNEKEAAQLAQVDDWHQLPLEELLRTIQDRYCCGSVIVTLGSEGSAGLEANAFWQVPPIAVDTVDTSGAGDAFLSAMLVNLVWGADTPSACAWAGAFASYTTTAPGTIPSYPTLSEYQATAHYRRWFEPGKAAPSSQV